MSLPGSRLIQGRFHRGMMRQSLEFSCTGDFIQFQVLAQSGFGGIGKDKIILNVSNSCKRIILQASLTLILHRCSGQNFSILTCGQICYSGLVLGLCVRVIFLVFVCVLFLCVTRYIFGCFFFIVVAVFFKEMISDGVTHDIISRTMEVGR